MNRDPITGSRPIHTHSEITVERGVCAAGHPVAAQAAIDMMREGGNAVDALAAASFASFVVEPGSCGIGGYTHISVYLREPGVFVTFDAYGRAPRAATETLFESDSTHRPAYFGRQFAVASRAQRGFLAPTVPGAIAGTCDAHAAYGRLPLALVLEPAISAARAGVPFAWYDKLSISDLLPVIEALPDTAAVLLPGGHPPALPYQDAPDRIDTSRLAETLEVVAREGKQGFYAGRVAQTLARYVGAHGGILDAHDLAAYRTRTLREKPARYRNLDYIACFDQVAYEALNILEHFDLRSYGPDSVAYRHLAAEALGIAFVDSMTHYGDPDFESAPVNGLASAAFAAARGREIHMRRALPRPIAAGDPWPYEDAYPAPITARSEPGMGRREGTSQVAVADRDGNVASCCMSLGSPFGSLVYVPDLGCFLNNAMQNFDPRPGQPNSIKPGKMPIFAAPAIAAADAGGGRFAASGSGGYRIETGVLHTFMNIVDHRMRVQAAVDHPRVHCQGGETIVDARIPPAVHRRLAGIGHQVVAAADDPGTLHFGRVCAVTRDARTGALRAGAGPAWRTAIAGW